MDTSSVPAYAIEYGTPNPGCQKTHLIVPSFGRSLNTLFVVSGRESVYIQKLQEVQVGKENDPI